MARLTSKAAIVTGAASGIGAVTAQTLARHGAMVIGLDIDREGVERVTADIRASGGDAVPLVADITDLAVVDAAFAAGIERAGRLDILVNCAALTDPAHQRRDLAPADLAVDVWDRTLTVDALGTLLCCQQAVQAMAGHGGGSIVNVSSNSALGGDLGLTAYAAAKAAVNSISRSIATVYGKQGVRCNVVSPGGIRSASFAANVSTEMVTVMEEQCLLPELGTPQDVANLVLFLASEESRYITGQVICVDGGALSHLPHVGSLRALRQPRHGSSAAT